MLRLLLLALLVQIFCTDTSAGQGSVNQDAKVRLSPARDETVHTSAFRARAGLK